MRAVCVCERAQPPFLGVVFLCVWVCVWQNDKQLVRLIKQKNIDQEYPVPDCSEVEPGRPRGSSEDSVCGVTQEVSFLVKTH